MSKQDLPSAISIEEVEKALDKLFDWMLGHDNEELANMDFRKGKREVLISVESYGDSRELQGQIEGLRQSKKIDVSVPNDDRVFRAFAALGDKTDDLIEGLEEQLQSLKEREEE